MLLIFYFDSVTQTCTIVKTNNFVEIYIDKRTRLEKEHFSHDPRQFLDKTLKDAVFCSHTLLLPANDHHRR